MIHSSSIRRRRVLWISHLLPWPPKGGVQQRSYHLIREVAKHHDLVLAGFFQRSQQKTTECVNAAMAAMRSICDVAWIEPLPADDFPKSALATRALLPSLPYTIRWAWRRSTLQRLKDLGERFAPDIVHFDTISLAQYRFAFPQCRLTLNHHNIESAMLSRRARLEKHLLQKLYFAQEAERLARYEKRCSSAFSLHLVCSTLDRDRLPLTDKQSRVVVVPNGTNLDYFRAYDPPLGDKLTMVFVGGLSWYPNVAAVRHFLACIWPRIASRKPAARLLLIGKEPPSDIIRAASADPRIEVLGFVDDIRPIVRQAAVYVCPIFDGGGTKLKMLDAMAMGKAIVAYPEACEGLGVVSSREVSIAASPEDFADRVVALLANPSEVRRLGSAARRHVEAHFDFNAIGRRMSEVYAALPDSQFLPASLTPDIDT